MTRLIADDKVDQRIYNLRGRRVILDRDLAKVYGVSTKRLNEQVKRNHSRFPEDFMFQLTADEIKNLMSQIATSSFGHGGHRKRPSVFTEHGAVAAAFIINSHVAVAASVQIVRAFNRLRKFARAHRDMALALANLASRVSGHDEQFKLVFEALQRLMDPPAKPRKKIGFLPSGNS
jgi:hypothetical protein